MNTPERPATLRLVVLITALIGLVYLAGYWPQRQTRLACEKTLDLTRASLERAEARNRLYGLQSRLIDLLATVEARNFGAAQDQASAFFNAVRAEAERPDQSQVRAALVRIGMGRDALTVALTQNDPAALSLVQGAMAQLRVALGDAGVVNGR
ncbi:MAG: hypothetical protein ABI565_02800 [Vicinamibacteria bacterium]